MRLADIVRHSLRRDDVILKGSRGPGQWDATQNPEKRWPYVSHRLHTHAARSIPGNERLHLNVCETRPALIAA